VTAAGSARLRWPLEPPYPRSLAGALDHLGRWVPVERFAPLVRTKAMGRWHRPRSGERRVDPDGALQAVSLQLWCGQCVRMPALTADEVPDGEKLCGTCEGRAVGAGYPAIAGEPAMPLLHQPVSSRPPPPICPAVRRRLVPTPPPGKWPATVACPACGELVRIRAYGSGSSGGGVTLQRHPPGAGLMAPCPFHRWDQLVLRDQRAVCSCAR
jgi:hypothetical protein